MEESEKSSSATCTIVDDDKERVKTLQAWIAKHGFHDLDTFKNSFENAVCKTLAELQTGSFFNLICQVS